MADLRVEKHLDKTFIGRISRGFDFLDIGFHPWVWGLLRRRWRGVWRRFPGLCVQGASVARIGEYLGRWWQWVRGWVNGVLMVSDRIAFGLVGEINNFSLLPRPAISLHFNQSPSPLYK
ncbi:hypothetical protein [Microcoleus sp. D3_18_C4]|uniref:hypothetical protein n=1 Tax=Microcoleus sp. D3_18_C4 TaxID=3055335 RepID=UPI002FD29B98